MFGRSSAVALIALVLLPGAAFANLITNGGFETGDFTGWTVTGTKQYYGVSHNAAHSGSWGAWFGDIEGLTYIAQTVPTTPGAMYDISLWVANPLESTNRAEVWWDGIQIVDETNSPPYPFQLVSWTLTASTSSTEFLLGGNNPPGYWLIDDIEISQVPEPSSVLLASAGIGFLIAFAVRRRTS